VIGWLDCASGVSGDMLLGALVDVGVPLEVMQAAVDAVAPEPVTLRADRTTRASLAATRVHVGGTDSTTHRTWHDVRDLLGTPRAQEVEGIGQALATFEALAVAEAAVHGTTPDEVHFHEVGALDAIADVVAASAGLAHLRLDALHASPVALGGGTVRAAHGRLSVPGPAVVRLLADAPTYGGPVEVELATPTGAALLRTHVTTWGAAPAMTSTTQGHGAGGRDLPGHANVLRLVVGEAWSAGGAAEAPGTAVVLETNVDDQDPRLWPAAIAALLAAGASDAWLTPILMKKGRPAHTLHVLVSPARADAVRAAVFAHTSAIGLREQVVRKHALDRTDVTVQVDGHPVRVKVASEGGRVLNAQPEWEDVAAAATALGRSAKTVLAQAISEYHRATDPGGRSSA
jgi:hypothetical protein